MSRNYELLYQLHRERELFQHAPPPEIATNPETEVSRLAAIEKRLFEVPAPPPGALSEPDSPRLAEFFRSETCKLVQRLFLAIGSSVPRSVVFSAVDQDSDQHWISAQVADLLSSHTEDSICLVDANLANPSLHDYFGVDNHVGLIGALLEPVPAKTFIRPLGRGRLQLMSAGELSNGTDLNTILASGRLRALMSELVASFTFVIVNAPPATSNFITAYLAALTDGLILVVEPSFTSRQAACDAKENVKAAGGRLLGVVFNERELRFSGRTRQPRGISKPAWNF